MISFTNRTAGIRGDTVVVTVRLPKTIVEFIDSHLSDELRTRSDWLQHSVALYCLLRERGES